MLGGIRWVRPRGGAGTDWAFGGADGLVVRNDIRKVNDLKGKVVISSSVHRDRLFIRYLAKQAGLASILPDLIARRIPMRSICFYEDGLSAGDLFLYAVKANSTSLAGCV